MAAAWGDMVDLLFLLILSSSCHTPVFAPVAPGAQWCQDPPALSCHPRSTPVSVEPRTWPWPGPWPPQPETCAGIVFGQLTVFGQVNVFGQVTVFGQVNVFGQVTVFVFVRSLYLYLHLYLSLYLRSFNISGLCRTQTNNSGDSANSKVQIKI